MVAFFRPSVLLALAGLGFASRLGGSFTDEIPQVALSSTGAAAPKTMMTWSYENCDRSQDGNAVHLDSLTLSLDAANDGKLALTWKGEALQTIKRGAYAKIVIKYGLIQLISTTVDMCQQDGITCPFETGHFEITQTTSYTEKTVPPGTYNVLIDGYTDDDESVLCVKIQANFPRPQTM
ncbi:ML domain-containing protein [Mycena galopus ATCC 62051]|nr:ML domain-containing protein [Mycena galopus ATCC 62051]